VEVRLNEDLAMAIERDAAAIERGIASFKKTVREQTRGIVAIVFSTVGVVIAFYCVALHFK
jgi:hypothetical protein